MKESRLRDDVILQMIGQNVVGSKLELECVDERMTGTLSCVADNGVEIVKSSVQISTSEFDPTVPLPLLLRGAQAVDPQPV